VSRKKTYKFPDSLKIGHQLYKIIQKDAEWFVDAERFGHCDFKKAIIAVAVEDLNPNHIGNTLLHETLHALWREYNLPTETEEHIVTCLANGLTQMASDNPEFLTIINNFASHE
jgi:hypothetical protein